MKFGKTAQLILAIGIFAIAIVFLYQTNAKRDAEYDGLNTQLATAQGLLPELVSDGQQLESRLNRLQIELAQAKDSLSDGKAYFPRTIDGIRYDELLFQMAHDRDLEMMVLETSDPAGVNVGDVTLTVTTFDIAVKGTVADILDFINVIAVGDDFGTATAEIVSITVPCPVSQLEKEEIVEQGEEESEEEEEELECGAPSAEIKLDIYYYRGS
jgi:hypothetical protein